MRLGIYSLGEFCLKCSANQTVGVEAQHKLEALVTQSNGNLDFIGYNKLIVIAQTSQEPNKV